MNEKGNMRKFTVGEMRMFALRDRYPEDFEGYEEPPPEDVDPDLEYPS